MYLVFDVGGTFIKKAVIEADGNILESDKFPSPVGEGKGLEDFLDAITEVYNEVSVRCDIEGIAMSIPGRVDVKRGIVYGGGILNYLDNQPVGELISGRCGGIRVSLENDGKCAALCEAWKGNASDAENAYVLVFGTGIGGGLIINKCVFHGTDLLAGEVSFTFNNMTIEQADDVKRCESLDGTDEVFHNLPYMQSASCATAGLCYKVAIAKDMKSEDVSGELIYKWAGEGDKQVIDILENWYFDIAKLCLNIYLVCNPDVILIGGGISAQPLFIEGIKRYIDKLKKMSDIMSNIRIDICKYRNRSNLYGALMNFKQLFESE